MTEQEYLSSRVDDQIAWYGSKSLNSQRWFKWLRGVEILAAAAIPLIAGFAEEPFPVALVLGLLGALIAVISSFVSLNQFQKNWIEYRTTCESLKHEKYLFQYGAEPYHEAHSFPLFVQRVEGLISRENSAWLQYTKAAIEESKVVKTPVESSLN